MLIQFFIGLTVLTASRCLSDIIPLVSTPLGVIKGHYLSSYKGERYAAYEGVPYAEPPIGNRRFQPPVPVGSWSGLLSANELKPTCWQHERTPFPSGSLIKGDEDCLYLNIYVPPKRSNASLPVLFWIHGGAFQYGGAEREAEYLMDHDVILVSIQYRLGVLGFLSTEDEVVPGNMGLKDQSMALRWIHDNVKYFGGDPAKVTLLGLSAGGASVHYHYLSPMSSGLFHSGISMSGTAFDCWTQTENSRDKTMRLAEIVGCPSIDTDEMVDCLMRKPASTLTEAQANFMPWMLNPFTPFGPVAERSSKQPFIDSSPIEILTSGRANDVPWITGVVSEEGLYPVAEFTTDAILKDINDNWESIAPLLLDYYYTIPSEDHASVARKIRKQYFGEKSINRENLSILTYLVGDRIFSVDAAKAAEVQAEANRSPVWFYYYSYRAVDSSSDKPSNSTEDFGVCHGDDIYLVLRNSDINPTKSAKDMMMQKDVIQLLMSVAQTGAPKLHFDWPKLKPQAKSLKYVHIRGPGEAVIRRDDNFSQKSFWSSIDFSENKITDNSEKSQ